VKKRVKKEGEMIHRVNEKTGPNCKKKPQRRGVESTSKRRKKEKELQKIGLVGGSGVRNENEAEGKDQNEQQLQSC